MLTLTQSKTFTILTLVVLLAGFAQPGAAAVNETSYSTGYEEVDCGIADTSYLAAP